MGKLTVMNHDSQWQSLCAAANLHLQTTGPQLPPALRPALARAVTRFVSQPPPASQLELNERQRQAENLGKVVAGITGLGVILKADIDEMVMAAEELATLNLDAHHPGKFELDVALIAMKGASPDLRNVAVAD